MFCSISTGSSLSRYLSVVRDNGHSWISETESVWKMSIFCVGYYRLIKKGWCKRWVSRKWLTTQVVSTTSCLLSQICYMNNNCGHNWPVFWVPALYFQYYCRGLQLSIQILGQTNLAEKSNDAPRLSKQIPDSMYSFVHLTFCFLRNIISSNIYSLVHNIQWNSECW